MMKTLCTSLRKPTFIASVRVLMFMSCALFPVLLNAQDNLKIKDPDGNVLLEAREDGVLVRKMTTAVRTAVAGLDADDNGLMVYDTDTKSFWHWKDTEWVEVDGIDLVDDADADPTNELQSWSNLPGIPTDFADGVDDVNDADSDPTNELQDWSTLPGIPVGFADGVDDVNDADSDPTNELDTWSTLPGIPAGFTDGVDNVDDADNDPANELDTWSTLPGIPAGFMDGVDNVDDADSDPTNELDTWSTLPGIPVGFTDGVDDVNDADSDPTNELQDWSTLPGIPVGFTDGVDDVNDADSDPLNEKNTALVRNGTQLELTDVGGTLVANIGWAIAAGKVFNSTDNVGIGTSTTPARLTVQNGAILFDGMTGATPVSGAGTRLMWVPSKHAFRAGIVTSAQWDDSNIGSRSFVGGGTDNIASGWNSIVAGGGLGSAIADGAFVGGGYHNTASGINSFVSGGDDNTASGLRSFVGGGILASAIAENSFVGGGYDNTSSGFAAFVGGGVQNAASGGTSFVGGGLLNTASGYASFATGRESTASGNHSFAGGYGLTAKAFGETVFGSFNTNYTPVSTEGFAGTDRLFVIGNGTSNDTRSDAMTILKDGKVGIGTSTPATGLHVKGSKGLGEHVMLIENQNHEGSGLKIQIDGSHPLWVQGEGGNPDFFITRPVNALEVIFEDVAGDIRDYLLSDEGIDLSNINLSEITSPAGLIDQLGLTDFLSGGLCKGVETLVDLVNSSALSPIQLPDLPLDAIPQDLVNVPLIPEIPAIPNFSINPPSFEICIGLNGNVCGTINPPGFSVSSAFINTPIDNFNSLIGTVNTGINTANTSLENGYDKIKDGILMMDGLEIPLPQLQMPTSIGPVTCPNPNPWDDFNISFEKLNPSDYNILNPLSSDNEFITFVDAYNNKLGAIKGQSIAEFNLDYFKMEKVLEIGGTIVGLFSDDGSMAKNGMKLVKEAINFYKAADKIGVEYSSGHGDYAEWLERENHTEVIGYGDIIGIRGGKVSLSTEGAEQVMVVSKAPIVRGNVPVPDAEENGNNIAFIGQVPVKVMGPVTTGDYIVANPSTPGYGIAVKANEITSNQLALAVGRSWETNTSAGFKFVNTIVGMHNNGWAVPVTKLQQRLDSQEAAIQALTERLDNLEYESGLASTKRTRR